MDDWLYTAVPNIHCNSFYIVILLLLLWSSLFMRPLEEVICWSFLCFPRFVADRVFPFPIRGSGIEGVICRTDSKSLWNLSYLNKLDLRCMKQTNEVNLLVLLCSAMDLFVWFSYDNTNDSLLIDFFKWHVCNAVWELFPRWIPFFECLGWTLSLPPQLWSCDPLRKLKTHMTFDSPKMSVFHFHSVLLYLYFKDEQPNTFYWTDCSALPCSLY